MADCKERTHCKVEGCERRTKCGGYCAAHHARKKRGATVDVPIGPRRGGVRGRRGPLVRLGAEVPVRHRDALRLESKRRGISMAQALEEVLDAWQERQRAEAWEAEGVAELKEARRKVEESSRRLWEMFSGRR